MLARLAAPLLAKARRSLGGGNDNETRRQDWVRAQLAALPAGTRLLDAGAGEQQFRPFCGHLHYVSQDFCQYEGQGDGSGLHTGAWDTSRIDLVCDITAIPEPDAAFDAVLCTEVLEHLPDPVAALREFARLLRPGGVLLLTAPFASLTHFAPYHFATGFNRYFYQDWLPRLGFAIDALEANGDYFALVGQEVLRSRALARPGPLGQALLLGAAWVLAGARRDGDSAALGCFGYHVRARRREA